MTLGAQLRRYLPDGVEQKVIAMNWIERMSGLGQKSLSPSTAQSRLSELLADDPQGVRAFFRDPQRANALFDVLAVPDVDRPSLCELAALVLVGASPPRLVVDISDLGHNPATMDILFTGLRTAVFSDEGVFPVALVLTDGQYNLLPRSFDRLHDRIQVERVADDAAGAATAVRLAGEALCLLARRPLVELARWWAVDIARGAMVLEPVDGLERLRASGSIGVPAVLHPLDFGGVDSAQVAAAVRKLPDGGAARRRLIEELADELSETSRESPAQRAVAALALGVQATSTQRERIEAEIAATISQLGIPVPMGTAAEWDVLVAGAGRRPVTATAMRVGDHVRVLNPPDGVTTAARLEVVRITCAEPHLTTLEKAVAELTEDHLLDDPLLGRLIHRLAGGDESALKLLLHARAVLVFGGRVKRWRAPAAADPLEVLGEILARDPPLAQLRISVKEAVGHAGPLGRRVKFSPFAYPKGRKRYLVREGALLLSAVPPVGDVLLERGVALHLAEPERAFEVSYGYRDPHQVLVDPSADAATWLEDVDRSRFFGAKLPTRKSDRHLPEPGSELRWSVVAEPDELWLEADTNLGLVWLALREALSSPRWIRLPEGSILLQVGGGLVARVYARRYGQVEDAVRGAVRCTVSGVISGPVRASTSPAERRRPGAQGLAVARTRPTG